MFRNVPEGVASIRTIPGPPPEIEVTVNFEFNVGGETVLSIGIGMAHHTPVFEIVMVLDTPFGS